jgi:hypothetical protein
MHGSPRSPSPSSSFPQRIDAEGKKEEEDDEEEEGTAGLKWSNRVAWSFFAHEIAVLNERFIPST